MFWKRKNLVQEQSQKAITIPHNIEVVREIVNDYKRPPNESHATKLQLLKQPEIEHIPQRIKEKLEEHNIRCFIPFEYIKRFTYHASLWAYSPEMHIIDAIYQGDVPDCIIDKATIAKECGVRFLTIHSMQTLPIKLTHCDPVLAGWYSYEAISVDNTGKITNVHWGNREVAIIATWDYEKEIPVLG